MINNKEISIKPSTIVSVVLVFPVLATFIFWIFAYNIAYDFSSTLQLFTRIQAHIFTLFALIAFIAAIVSFATHTEHKHKLFEAFLIVLSLVLFALSLWSIL